MVIPSLRPPTWDDVRDAVRRCRLPPDSAEDVGPALVRLEQELKADMALPDAERRARRRARLSTLRAVARALRRCTDALETAPPHAAEELRRLLACDIGRFLSSAAFGALADQPISARLPKSGREPQDKWRAGHYPQLEGYAEAQRQEAASRHGDRLLATFTGCLAERLEAALAVELLNTGGRPADRARRIALYRLVQLPRGAERAAAVGTAEQGVPRLRRELLRGHRPLDAGPRSGRGAAVRPPPQGAPRPFQA